MGKYGRYERGRERKERKWEVHPVWRGIGCLILIMMPILAYSAADVFITFNSRAQILKIPPDFYAPMGVKYIEIEDFNFSYPINFGELKLGVLAFSFVFLFVELGGYWLLYAMLYRFMAPPRYGPTDSPPIGRYRPPPDLRMKK